MNWKKWMSMGIAAALVLSSSNLNTVKADEGEKKATAYLYFMDTGWTSDAYYNTPGGGEQTKTIAQDAQVTGDGIYHLSLDFTQTNKKYIENSSQVKISIVNGDTIFGSDSIITIQKVMINGTERTSYQEGFTANEVTWENGEQRTNTIFWLFNSNAEWEIGSVQGDRVEGAERTAKELNPFSDFGYGSIETVEVDFRFSVNGASDPGESSDPNKSPDPGESSDPGESADPNESSNPGESSDPNESSDPSESSNPGKSPSPSGVPVPSGSPSAGVSPDPNVTSNPNTDGSTNSGLVSNSTYTGAEKILVQNNAVIIPAGGNSTITFALLRSAVSSTQVTVSSGNTGIASPVLQNDGKVRIHVPASAAAGGSTTVILRFGSSTASIKVTVRNAVTKIKATKKSYQVKRKKKTKIVYKLTTQNKSKATTDVPVVKMSGKKASVSSVKIAGSKLTVTVKGVKKGSAALKVTVGVKTAKTKIKVK